ncbi:tetratricopeptide repeat protein [bacterium]|nr:tetratricopeptide repeat protein [bacterium]
MNKIIRYLMILIIPGILWGGKYDKYIQSGDLFFMNEKYEDAAADYLKAIDENPNEPKAYYKAGRAYNQLGMVWYGEKQHEYFQEAIKYLTEAVKLDSKMWEAHLEIARAIGTLGLFKPDWKQYTLAKRVKEELDIVFKYEDKSADAYYLLGMWHRWVYPRPLLWRKPIGLGEASYEDAVNNLRKAVDMDHSNLRYKLELAKLLGENGHKEQALELVAQINKNKPEGDMSISQEYIFKEANNLSKALD